MYITDTQQLVRTKKVTRVIKNAWNRKFWEKKTILCLRLLGWGTTGLEPLYAFCALRLYRLEGIYCILPMANGKTALSGPRSTRYPGFTIALCPLHSVVSSGRVISPTQKPVRNNTQRSQQRDIQTHGGFSNPQSHNGSGRRTTP
jgi:hypothetical protein